jgi:hypothetical protein
VKKVIGLIISISLIVGGCYLIYDASIRPFVDEQKVLESSDSVLIGDEVTDKDGVVFCVTNVDNSNSLGEGYSEIKTDNNFVVVTVKITNNSSEPYDVNPLNFMLLDGDNEYEHTNDALLSLENVMFIDTINPSLSNEYIVVYETATTTEESEYKLKIKHNYFKNIDNTYITLKEVE